ncbi:putative sulfite reductase-associated electron transfer protein DsrP [Desulfatibacillum alkenivorans DSM 16219]|jgi:molybdopterin-containing oxidoreductase family membrane subunit|uniref:Putative sulfite reductase-associated electron transfer protein DsrP n=1 Tax=Desulfatibacillum alkenivorans DSM 16219 TaxID=1121393 RepID=A0A1M6PAL2_9BACT|nr:NrfD/PsrC family molybdoenzyme membrane anchor subunit [Desulfatibacillum alkenivorans]SHK04974.1 putative sulfite reductase-associated electron transfer protein DsrP [Desulfatibacillum alkenivorans DSM 16219]
MLEKALTGDSKYWGWIGFLLLLIAVGFGAYLRQFNEGLTLTGLSRDVSWGFYIAQLTYLVGVAASGVMLVMPYYLHDHKAFGKITILGEFMAVGAITMCLLFVLVDLGQPMRMMNMIIFPTPNSVLFWDMVVLNTYMFLNIIIGWTVLQNERKGIHYQKWVKVLIYLSIPFAVSIHTVTAFLYAGLPGRHFWLTAIMAPRFLAGAFCAGPAILLLIVFFLRRFTSFDAGDKAIKSLAVIITYAMILNVFFLLLELFTAFYSQLPGHMHAFVYLFAGLHGGHALVPVMWASVILAVIVLILLIPPKFRNNYNLLIPALIMLVLSTWLEKGVALVVAGFIPNPLEHVNEYAPTLNELVISVGVYAVGALIVTVLYKIAIGVKAEVGDAAH